MHRGICSSTHYPPVALPVAPVARQDQVREGDEWRREMIFDYKTDWTYRLYLSVLRGTASA
jgi:hypothetical protein